MCEYSASLVAWLDNELENDLRSEIARHLEDCTECQEQLHKYEQVSKTFDAYCDAVMDARTQRGMQRWVIVASGIGFAVAAAALILLLSRTRVEAPILPSPAVTAPQTQAFAQQATPSPAQPPHRRHASSRPPKQIPSWSPVQPFVEVVIPAEAVFPPGAFPEGTTFTADLGIAADGSAERIRLRPRLIGIERRITQP